MRVTGHDYEWTPKFFAVLTGLFCGAYIVVAVMNLKMLDVLGLVIPGGFFFFRFAAFFRTC